MGRIFHIHSRKTSTVRSTVRISNFQIIIRAQSRSMVLIVGASPSTKGTYVQLGMYNWSCLCGKGKYSELRLGILKARLPFAAAVSAFLVPITMINLHRLSKVKGQQKRRSFKRRMHYEMKCHARPRRCANRITIFKVFLRDHSEDTISLHGLGPDHDVVKQLNSAASPYSASCTPQRHN